MGRCRDRDRRRPFPCLLANAPDARFPRRVFRRFHRLRSDRRNQRALRIVPRHEFVPGTHLAAAYADDAIVIKWKRGLPASSISQPTMVARMLEMLDVHTGDRVLEIGTGSGYNAALLAELVGKSGRVVSLELDGALAQDARAVLDSIGYRQIDVVNTDGRNGWPGAAPYDRIIATASVTGLEAAWIDQLRDVGRLIVPLINEREATVYAKTAAGLEKLGSSPALFIPMS
jgi:protein-L-isoaspartate(D-aspartate) O-methyltransferase